MPAAETRPESRPSSPRRYRSPQERGSNAGALRIGIVDIAAEPITTNHDDEAILLDVTNKDFDTGNRDGVKFFRRALRRSHWRLDQLGGP